MDVDMVLVAINGVDVRYFPKHEVDLMIKKSKKTVNLTFQSTFVLLLGCSLASAC